MTFTVVGWFENQDSAALILTAALADQHVRVVGDDIIVPSLNKLMAVYAYGADLVQAQLSSPSLRKKALLDICPLDKLDEPPALPSIIDLFDRPITLEISEALNFLGAEDNAAAGDMAAFAWLGDGITPLPAGEIFTVEAAGTTTLTADAWTNVPITFSQTLPAGRYAIVGMRAQAAGLRAARLVIPGFSWRPGVLGFDADLDTDWPRFRLGNAGVFAEFEHDAPPTIDCMSLSADTAENFWLDLIQTRAGRA